MDLLHFKGKQKSSQPVLLVIYWVYLITIFRYSKKKKILRVGFKTWNVWIQNQPCFGFLFQKEVKHFSDDRKKKKIIFSMSKNYDNLLYKDLLQTPIPESEFEIVTYKLVAPRRQARRGKAQ